MATTSVTTTETLLRSQESIRFIRRSNIVLNVAGARPRATLHVYFDGVLVDEHCGIATFDTTIPTDVGLANPSTINPNIGKSMRADANGSAIIVFSIPANTFNTGVKEVIVTDAPTLDLLETSLDTQYGSCRGTYEATGTLSTWQTVVTVTNTNYTDIVLTGNYRKRRDPVAQSFFTHGVKGGVFVTAIDIYFMSKDPNEVHPVMMDIRKMVNGFPGEQEDDPYFTSIVQATDVKTSSLAVARADESVPTKFVFNPPVYLKEDSDYCFVVSSNSNSYYIYRAETKAGVITYENGKPLQKNPYIGSMFKSENNYTWTAEQTMDLKFQIHTAKFDVNKSSTVTLMADDLYNRIPGSRFYLASRLTTDTTAKISYSSPVKHGFTGDGVEYISIRADEKGTYNGIPGKTVSGVGCLTGHFLVTEIIDEYKLKFEVPNLAVPLTTTAGKLRLAGTITSTNITAAGSGYGTATEKTLVFTGGGGSGAAGVALIKGDKAVKIKLTNRGTGYTSAPVITIAGIPSFAATASIEASLLVATNIPFAVLSPMVFAGAIEDSSLTTTLTTHTSVGGSYTQSTQQETINVFGVEKLSEQKTYITKKNAAVSLASQSSLKLDMVLRTNNENVSPIIDLRRTGALGLTSFKINNQNQTEEVATSGYVTRIVVSSGGVGYDTAPTVQFENAPNDTSGAGAAGTAVIEGGVLKKITITNAGAGYLFPPTVILSGGTPETEAVVYAELNISAQNGSIATVSIASGGAGTGYDTPPTVTVVPAPGDYTGGGATVTASVAGGSITGFNITNAGYGYTKLPSIKITGGGVSATGGAAVCTLTKFNTETGGEGNRSGSAYSRYLTKKITLTTISSGVKIISDIASTPETSVDVYIRTSLSGNNQIHTDQKWILLQCDVKRNKSNSASDFWEYTFYNDDLLPFDVYDLKFVLSSTDPAMTPTVKNYRVIIAV